MKKIFGIILLVMGFCLGGFGLIGAAIELDKLIAGTATDSLLGFGLAGFLGAAGAASMVGGGLLTYFGFRKPLGKAKAPRALMEPKVLRLAARRGGRITPAQLAVDLGRPFEDANTLLEELARKGACDLEVTEEGGLVYEFKGLLPERQI